MLVLLIFSLETETVWQTLLPQFRPSACVLALSNDARIYRYRKYTAEFISIILHHDITCGVLSSK